MRLIKLINEDEMIATFLAGEIASKRFGYKIHDALKKHGLTGRIIQNPDLLDTTQNRQRRLLLQEAREYGSDNSWFAGWPTDIQWYKAEFDHGDLASIRYIVYSYWIELTGGSLKAGDAIKTIRSGKEIFGQSNQHFLDAAAAIQKGSAMPPMIVVGTNEHDLVVLEGHLRLTAYLLAGKPQTIQAIVGLSPNFSRWKMYSFSSYDTHR